MADLKGKRVSTGSPGSATEVMAFRVIEAAGLDKDKDMKRERLGVAESVNAIKDRKIDAFFWVGGLPTAAVTDLGATPGVKIKMIDHADLVGEDEQEVRRSLRQRRHQGRHLSRAGQGQQEHRRVEHPGRQRQDVGSTIAYNIVKTMFDKKADLVAVHSEAKNFKLENQVKAYSPIPWHPGAVKYMAENGVKM